MSKVIKAAFTFRITEDSFVQAIAAGMIAGPHGYGYWCEEVRAVSKSGRALSMTDEQIARHVLGGGVAEFKCYEDDGRKWTEQLTRAKLMTGFGLYMADGGRSAIDESTGVTDFDIDAPASDRVMQWALFGKQVYG